jgi:flavin-dependent dehydrogenase
VNSTVDVLVVGGGPGGSTAAALLARAGLSVLLLERETFPRYHIGESLLASCLPTLRLSGAFDAVAAHGFTVKRGAIFQWAADTWPLDWAKLVSPDAWSWQVDRAEYDHILLRNAATQGAEVIEGATVKRLILDGNRPVAAEWVCAGDTTVHSVGFTYLVDASGRAGLSCQQKLITRAQHEVFQNVAVWGYWTGARALPGCPSGGISVVSSPDGWWWNIPLSGDRSSVGFVTHRRHFADSRPEYPSLEDYYLSKAREHDEVRTMTADAVYHAPVRAEQDYSYVSDRFCGPGHLAVGDAACFLDPLLSTGVHLAQYSAMIAAASIISTSRGEIAEDDAWAFFEYTYRRAYTRLLVLVSRLYQKYDGKDDYFWHAQKLVHAAARQDEAVRDFSDITTGLTDIREAGEVDLRVVNEALIDEAERAQDAKAAGSGRNDLHGLDLSASWGPWHSLLGPETTVGDLYLTTTPELGLRRG